MGLDERSALGKPAKGSDYVFVSDIDGKTYARMNLKSTIRRKYIEDIIRTRILDFNTKRKAHYERLPREIGYSLNFGRDLIRCEDDDKEPVTNTNDLIIFRQRIYNHNDFTTFRLSDYYADMFRNIYADKIDLKPGEFFRILGPPRGGITYELSIADIILRKYVEFIKEKVALSYHQGKEMIENKTIPDAPQRGPVIICDDCLITGKSIKREARKLGGNLYLAGIIVGVDCGLYGESGKKVSEEIKEELGVAVNSIVDIEEVMHHFKASTIRFSSYPVKDDWSRLAEIEKSIPMKEIRNYLHRENFEKLLDKHFDLDKERKLFDKEVYRPYVKFMKLQKQVIDLKKTASIIRKGK